MINEEEQAYYRTHITEKYVTMVFERLARESRMNRILYNKRLREEKRRALREEIKRKKLGK